MEVEGAERDSSSHEASSHKYEEASCEFMGGMDGVQLQAESESYQQQIL